MCIRDRVRGITELITTPGLINTDFADVRMIMNDAGSALMGTGEGNGEQRATSAARKAVSSPLLESPIDGARGILLSITGSSNLTLNEVNEAAELVLGVAHPDANIIFGTVVDEAMGDSVRVTVIAAGFDRWEGTTSPQRTSLGSDIPDVFGNSEELDEEEVHGDLDVPDFLK